MCRRLDMTVTTMSDRYRERTPWTLDELERVADVFGVAVADLLARPKGFEPLTFWLGADHSITAWRHHPGMFAFFCDECGHLGPYRAGAPREHAFHLHGIKYPGHQSWVGAGAES